MLCVSHQETIQCCKELIIIVRSCYACSYEFCLFMIFCNYLDEIVVLCGGDTMNVVRKKVKRSVR